jgi:hypothetical protein
MGNNFPNLKKTTEFKTNKEFAYCISTAQGFRNEQEDKENGYISIYDDDDGCISFFAVK